MNRYHFPRGAFARTALGASVVVLWGAACSVQSETSTDVGSSRGALTEPQCAALNTNLSLVVHDQATIDAADFSLTRTLEAIANSSGGAPVDPATLLKTLIVDFALPNNSRLAASPCRSTCGARRA